MPERAASGYLGLNRNETFAKQGWDMVGIMGGGNQAEQPRAGGE